MLRYIFTDRWFTFGFIFLFVLASLFCVCTLHDFASFNNGINRFRVEESWKKCDNFCKPKTTNSVTFAFDGFNVQTVAGSEVETWLAAAGGGSSGQSVKKNAHVVTIL